VPHSTKVLIVEDEHIFADNLRRYLERRGWLAMVANTGRMAIAASADFAPDVVLLDYRLPDIDGFQVLREIRSVHSSCRCVLMTAHPADTVSAGAEQLRIRRILYKPFTLFDMEAELLAAHREDVPALPAAVLR
jgi:DNA-binding response OmpR family regulator